MRGKVGIAIRYLKNIRITPAYAGKSRLTAQALQAEQDHPRLCGEKVAMPVTSCIAVGITPAYAGKRQDDLCGNQCTEDHPRLCGEKVLRFRKSHFQKGSPPPMRGKGFIFAVRVKRQRITPAYAGKRDSAAFDAAGKWDHPRLCGEKAEVTTSSTMASGSPPPMRGKGVSHSSQTFVSGITPAYAGKSGFSMK